MGDINKTTYFYRKKFKSKLAKFNVPGPLPEYFKKMIGDKKSVVIAEVGAGPINTIGNYWPGVDVHIKASDVMMPEYDKFWAYHKATPIVPVVYEDMEHLSYPNDHFDIVHCVNALDHTPDAKQALNELIRVCKPNGWIYLRHSPNQMTRFGGMHAWNIYMEGETCVFKSKDEEYVLGGLWKTTVEDGLIVSICQKI